MVEQKGCQAGYFSDSRYGGQAVLPGPPGDPCRISGVQFGVICLETLGGYLRNRTPLVGRRGVPRSGATALRWCIGP